MVSGAEAGAEECDGVDGPDGGDLWQSLNR